MQMKVIKHIQETTSHHKVCACISSCHKEMEEVFWHSLKSSLTHFWAFLECQNLQLFIEKLIYSYAQHRLMIMFLKFRVCENVLITTVSVKGQHCSFATLCTFGYTHRHQLRYIMFIHCQGVARQLFSGAMPFKCTKNKNSGKVWTSTEAVENFTLF